MYLGNKELRPASSMSENDVTESTAPGTEVIIRQSQTAEETAPWMP